jgi:hypothetical protein
MPAQVLVEEEVLERLTERAIVGNALVELEVGIDDLLDTCSTFWSNVSRTFSRVLTRAAASSAASSSSSPHDLCQLLIFSRMQERALHSLRRLNVAPSVA